MPKGILGRKVGMTQVYTDAGEVIPVTVIQAGPCHVLQIRTADKDGYEGVQIGFLDLDRKRVSRSKRGQVASISSKRSKRRSDAGVQAVVKAGCEPKRFVRELRGSVDGLAVGQELKVDVLTDVKKVDVIGTSKGRGFSGVIKRHKFSGQRASHGVKKCHRHPGSTGMSAFPSRTIRGKRMAGQHGNTQVTTRNIEVVSVDAVNNLLVLRGAVPGPNGGFVMVRETNKV